MSSIIGYALQLINGTVPATGLRCGLDSCGQRGARRWCPVNMVILEHHIGYGCGTRLTTIIWSCKARNGRWCASCRQCSLKMANTCSTFGAEESGSATLVLRKHSRTKHCIIRYGVEAFRNLQHLPSGKHLKTCRS